MAERDFFRDRHTIPGALFLLLIILLNWNVILNKIPDIYPYLKMDLVTGIVLVLFGTFGLTIIGFIISQIWFLIYWLGHTGLFLIIKEKNYAHVFLFEIGVKRSQITFQVITDYFGISSDVRIGAYLNRRLDLVHTFGSSIVAIILSIFMTTIIWQTNINYLMITFLSVLMFAMGFSALNIHLENLKMVEYIVRLEYKEPYRFWRKIPDEYRENHTNERKI